MFIEYGSGGFPGTGMIGASGFPGLSAGSGGDLPDPPAPVDGCVIFLDLANGYEDQDYTATLTVVTPSTVGGRATVDEPQEKAVDNSTGRILFDAVPQGCRVYVICDHAGINATYQVPAADYLALATATPL